MNPEPELIGAIQGWLCTQRQLVCAEELNPESVMARTGVSCTEYAGAVCSVVKLPLALGGGKKRRLRKISSQWARRRPEAIAQHEMVRQVRQEELLQIEQTSSKYRRGIALFGLASTRAVFADAFTGLGQAGLLVRSSVHLDGSVIASLYCVVYPDKLSAYYMAFDDRYAQISPGVWLMIQLMQYAQEQGYQSVDLSRGVSAFKVLFADYTYQQTIRLFGTGPGYLAGRLVHSGANFLDSVRGRMRQRFGISSNETDEQPEE
jgi:CelD/BcsL family acetyltransferase involved in cellulose biosynthesis